MTLFRTITLADWARAIHEARARRMGAKERIKQQIENHKMKIKIQEYDHCISLDLTPETVADAATLARMKMNTLAKAPGVWAEANQDGTFSGTVQLYKAKEVTSYITRK